MTPSGFGLIVSAIVKSLAEHLGVQDPMQPAGGPAPDDLVDISDPADFCKSVLESREFRQYIVSGLVMRDLPPAVLCRIADHGWGKPVERVEVKDTTITESLTAEQLEARAERLAEMARFLRRAEQFDEPLTSDSVH